MTLLRNCSRKKIKIRNYLNSEDKQNYLEIKYSSVEDLKLEKLLIIKLLIFIKEQDVLIINMDYVYQILCNIR